MPRNVSKATTIRRILQYHDHLVSRRSSFSAEVKEGGVIKECSTKEGSLKECSVKEGIGAHDIIDTCTIPKLFVSDHGANNVNAEQPVELYDVELTTRTPSQVFDFIMCIGDDRTDETMFEYLNQTDDETESPQTLPEEDLDTPRAGDMHLHVAQENVVTCTVGSKSSSAKYFVGSYHEVLDMLKCV